MPRPPSKQSSLAVWCHDLNKGREGRREGEKKKREKEGRRERKERRERRKKKKKRERHKETFESDSYVYYLDCGNGNTSVCIYSDLPYRIY